MAFFWMKSKPEGVDVPFLERLKKLETKVNMLENDLLNQATSISSIRSKIITKIMRKEAKDEETPQDLYNGMLIKTSE